jgi:hypothetical protein
MLIEGASCDDCAKETHAIEGHCAGRMFKALRVHQRFPTRRPKERPTHLEILEGKTPHNAPVRLIPVADAPGTLLLPEFEPPGILLGKEPSPSINVVRTNVYTTTRDAVIRQRKLIESGLVGALAYTEYEPIKFARVLAKIAHCLVVHAFGINSFDPLLVPTILGKDSNVSYCVGSNGPVPDALFPPTVNSLHQVGTDTIEIKGVLYIFAQIRLFSGFRPLSPIYTIVVGEFFRP